MKKITLSMIAIVLASLVFVLSGCEMSLNLKEETVADTQSHTVIVEVTDDSGEVIATEAVTISEDEIKKGDTFFNKNEDDSVKTGVSSDRLQQAISNNKNNDDKANNNGSKENNADKNDKGDKVDKDDTVIKDDKVDQDGIVDNGGNNVTTIVPDNSDGKKPGNQSQNNNQTNDDNYDDMGDMPYIQDDAQVLRSTQFMLTGRVVFEGTVTPYKVARSGEKLAMFSEVNGQQIGIIINGDIVYMLSTTEKTYIELSKEMLKENMTEEELANLTGSALDLEKEVKKTMNQTEDGVAYNVVVYEDDSRDYFVGTTIMKTVSSDGSVLYYDSVSPVVPSSVFAPPADYTRTTLDEEGVSEFVGSIETTEQA